MVRKSGIILCIAVACLVVIGVMMLASTSIWIEAKDAQYSHLKKQVVWLIVGLGAAIGMATIDYRILRNYWKWIFAGTVFLLILCYVPGIAVERNGESRWIRFPVLGQFQPSEVAKLSISLVLASWLSAHIAEAKSFVRGFLVPTGLLGVIVGLIFFEKDMGTAVALGAAGFAMLFVAGVRMPYLLFSAAGGLGALSFVVMNNKNRMNRILAFMDLEANKLSYGLQQWRAKLALGSGGVEGMGLGNGAEKHGYLPFAHTDFIFAMIGQEFGLYGTLFVVFCFVMITVCGVAIALHAKDLFGRLLAIGVVSSIVAPAMLNIGVVTSVLPNTGLPLPFISYGGSNLVFTMASIGLLIGIYRRINFVDVRELPIIAEHKDSIRL